MKYKKGDLVMLSPNSHWARGKTEDNPLNTPGVVLGYNSDLGYRVRWDKKLINDMYYDEDLIPATKLGRYLSGTDTESQT
jgi:hypothetical protein